jgi:hypothetical protein
MLLLALSSIICVVLLLYSFVNTLFIYTVSLPLLFHASTTTVHVHQVDFMIIYAKRYVINNMHQQLCLCHIIQHHFAHSALLLPAYSRTIM